MANLAVIGDYVRVWARNPLTITLQLWRSVISPEAPYSRIALAVGTERTDVRRLLKEADNTGLDDTMKRNVEVSGRGLQPSKALYVLCRLLRPRVVVETGVAEGLSSSYMLKALSDNGQGMLYSIDSAELAENGKPIGYLVPEDLKGRWSFRRGRSQQLLPGLMDEVGRVDMFFHDSDHSYGVVKFELETAYPYLREGGALAADDVFQTDAFFDVCRSLGIEPAPIGWRIGFGIKQRTEAEAGQ